MNSLEPYSVETVGASWDHPRVEYWHEDGNVPPVTTPGPPLSAMLDPMASLNPDLDSTADPPIFISPLIAPSHLYTPEIPVEQLPLIQSHSAPPRIPEDAQETLWTTRPTSARTHLAKACQWSSASASSAFASHASSTTSSSPTVSLTPHSPLVTGPHMHPYAQSYESLASSSAAVPLASSSAVVSLASSDSSPDLTSPASAPRRHRRVWLHAFEQSIFPVEELASLGAPMRRTIYTASLEAHIDKLHEYMATLKRPLVSAKALEQYTGLNCQTAKSLICGLVRDISAMQMRLAEIKRAEDTQANKDTHNCVISDPAIVEVTGMRLPPSEYIYPAFSLSGTDGVDSAMNSTIDTSHSMSLQ